tara:strand:+ start:7596 stop:8189 length:594 start_codon:yes stop_codon:yes gene_type:complete
MATVYILTNQSMPGLIKIGITERKVEERMRDLYSSSAVPLPFECYFALEVKDAKLVEKKIHHGFDDYRINENREFFEIDPDKAKSILSLVEGSEVTPKTDVVDNATDQQALDKQRNKQRFNFASVGISPGEILEFKKDKTITAKVLNDDKIEFEGKPMSLSPAALIVIHRMGYEWTKIAGPQFWCYKGKTLYDLSSN